MECRTESERIIGRRRIGWCCGWISGPSSMSSLVSSSSRTTVPPPPPPPLFNLPFLINWWTLNSLLLEKEPNFLSSWPLTSSLSLLPSSVWWQCHCYYSAFSRRHSLSLWQVSIHDTEQLRSLKDETWACCSSQYKRSDHSAGPTCWFTFFGNPWNVPFIQSIHTLEEIMRNS